jgi:hypothetical protein
MPDETRVFDVARPGHSSPSPTSKPVITGHHPAMSDPMVREDSASTPTQIPIQDSSEPAIMDTGGTSNIFGEPANSEPMLSHPAEPQMPPPSPEPFAPLNTDSSVFPTNNQPEPDPMPEATPVTGEPEAPAEHPGHVEGLHVSPAKRRSPLMVIVLVALLLLVGAYLLIDSGKLNSGINLPFHVFKQKTAAPPAKPAAKARPTVSPSHPVLRNINWPAPV